MKSQRLTPQRRPRTRAISRVRAVCLRPNGDVPTAAHLAKTISRGGGCLARTRGAFPEHPRCRPGDRLAGWRSVVESLAEVSNVHNCVASRITHVLTGKAALYHREVVGKGLTIQIEASP